MACGLGGSPGRKDNLLMGLIREIGKACVTSTDCCPRYHRRGRKKVRGLVGMVAVVSQDVESKLSLF